MLMGGLSWNEVVVCVVGGGLQGRFKRMGTKQSDVSNHIIEE